MNLIKIVGYRESSHKFDIRLLPSGMCVMASVNVIAGDWTAYGADDSPLGVLKHGFKIRQENAERLFPEIAKEYRWRD